MARAALALALALTAALSGCAVKTLHRTVVEPTAATTLDKKSPYLKAHMRDGRVYVLREWLVDPKGGTFGGQGDLLDVNRGILQSGRLEGTTDSVVLFETNVLEHSGSVGALTVLTVVSAALTAFCIASPKSCFGSCPTFYVSDGKRPILQAEGFSASVAPVLESSDTDALFRAKPEGNRLEVTMKNEALETHVVRFADLISCPRAEGGRAFATARGDFWRASSLHAPVRCLGPEGDCTAALRAFDGIERFSAADSTDLAARETIDLEFEPAAGGPLGVVLASRQSLLTTYLYYQTLAFMGREAGSWIAALERGDARAVRSTHGIGEALGGIEVLVPDSAGGWIRAGEDAETGPLATDVRVVPLPESAGDGKRVRLRLTQGAWRLDWVALARLDGPAETIRLEPVEVRRKGKRDREAEERLRERPPALTTYPGDEYTFVYTLPAGHEHDELFLESRGYYLEWMREEWMADENPWRAAMMMLQPKEALRALAPEYKRQEAQMEDVFWRSRYAHP